jgi:2-keto-3-deoxy-L-rhamnonate aldolase RhmA
MFRNPSAVESLRQRKRLFGCFLNLSSPIAAYMVGAAGFDVALLDQEHSTSGLDNAVHCVNALSSHPTELWVRVPGLDEHYLKRILDCGADGVMCPMINTAAQARDLVRFCHYPPRGIRGMAPGLGRHTGYGAFKDEYAARVGSALAIMPQIETAEAVDNIEEIVGVEGIDVVFIGPFDLSASYGHAGRPDHPVVAAAIEKIETAARRAGKALASLAMPNRDAKVLLDLGYDLIFAGADLNILRAGLETQLKSLRSAVASGT